MRQSLSENSYDPTEPNTNSGNPDAALDVERKRPANPAVEGWGQGCTRRNVLRGAAAATLAVGTGLSLAACAKPGIAVQAADVPVGGGKILTEANYVVTQPTAGQYKAFVKTCPHALAPVTSITNGQIVCSVHNSRFSIHDGSVIAGPAKKGLGNAKVGLSGKTLSVTA